MSPTGGGAGSFVSPAAAVHALAERAARAGTERLPLAHAAGRVLAEPLKADRPSPAADVSAMDGYAVRLSGLSPGRRPVAAEAMIGREPPALDETAAGVVRIVTGAPVPPGADAVIKREDVRELGEAIEIGEATIAAAHPGLNIRRRGENIAAGDEVVGAGRAIDAAVAGALACFGVAEPLVFRRVRVGVLVTGDELLGPGETPSPWRLRDSNGPALAALLGPCAWAEVVGPRRAPDEPEAVRSAAAALLAECDALLVTGGVSMGDRDFVPRALEEAGAEILFHKLPQRPGKPVLGAVTRDGKPVLALPGNPVSVLVTARRMACPVLARVAGLADPPAPSLVTVEGGSTKRLDLWWHRPVKVTGPGRARLVEGMGSGDLVSAARGDGFVELPPGETGPGPWPFYPWTI